jgi:hypothetical protein
MRSNRQNVVDLGPSWHELVCKSDKTANQSSAQRKMTGKVDKSAEMESAQTEVVRFGRDTDAGQGNGQHERMQHIKLHGNASRKAWAVQGKWGQGVDGK